MNIRSYGTDALLVELSTAAEAGAVRARLDEQPPVGMIETMPGLRTVLVRFDPRAVDAPRLARDLAAVEIAPQCEDGAPRGGEPTSVRVVYSGPDLDDVAAHAGLSADEVVTAHQRPTYRVALIGMAPGFYFLAGGDSRLQPPRRRSPRQDVPRGAVGLAGAFTGIYPKRGPGGWQLVGHVLDELWHPTRLPAALLTPGAAVKLTTA